MVSEDLVSIVMPTWNCGKFIGESIESVQAQTYINWELLIVDDCSTDNTREIVERYSSKDNRIKYHCLEQNSGAAIARNTALRMAQGRWVAFLDSDDLWLPLKLEKQVKFMIEGNYGFSYTKYEIINEFGEQIGKCVSGPKKISKIGMYIYCWPGCLTVMYDKHRVGDIQIEDIKKNNDYALWLKAVRQSTCYLLPETLAKYRKRSGSISNHGYSKLIRWHYLLFKKAEKHSILFSWILTSINMAGGIYKKLRY